MSKKRSEKSQKLIRKFEHIYGFKISYLCGGQKNKQPLIFIHGVLASAAIYRKFLNILSRKFRVYAIDLPGAGRSSMPKNILMVSDYTDIIRRFLEKLNIKKPIIMGHSAGGLMTLDMVIRHKNVPKKIVLIDSAGLKLNYNFNDLYVDLLLNQNWRKIKKYQLWREAMIIISDLIRGLLSPVYIQILKTNTFVEYEKDIKRIDIPVLIFWGEKDTLFPIRLGKKFNQLIPHSKFMPVQGDHDWLVTNPKKITPFMEKI